MAKKRIVVAIVVCILFLASCASVFFLITDPYKWTERRSASFAWGKFWSVQPGQPITEVTELLGDPIRRYRTDSGVEVVIFVDNGASWVVVYQRAIVEVDPSGLVLRRLMTSDP